MVIMALLCFFYYDFKQNWVKSAKIKVGLVIVVIVLVTLNILFEFALVLKDAAIKIVEFIKKIF